MDLRDTKIGKMVRRRNKLVLLTAIVVFLLGIYLLQSAVLTLNYFQILISLLIVGGGLYGFYLFIIRSKDLYNHPDIEKFLSFPDSNAMIALFENEIVDWPINGFEDSGYITGKFIVIQSTYRVRWVYFTEIMWAHAKHTQLYFKHVIPVGTMHGIVIYLSNGQAGETTISYMILSTMKFKIKGHTGPIDDKEILAAIARMAPFAYYGYDPEIAGLWQRDRQKLISDVRENMRQLNIIDPMEIPDKK